MPPEELSACCKVYPFFVMDHKWTGNPDSGLHCLLLGSRQARTTPHHKKSPAEAGLKAELKGIGGTPESPAAIDFPRHCGKKMPRFEAGLRGVSMAGSFVPRRQDNNRESSPGSSVLSFVGFILRQATLSCPQDCPVIAYRFVATIITNLPRSSQVQSERARLWTISRQGKKRQSRRP